MEGAKLGGMEGSPTRSEDQALPEQVSILGVMLALTLLTIMRREKTVYFSI